MSCFETKVSSLVLAVILFCRFCSSTIVNNQSGLSRRPPGGKTSGNFRWSAAVDREAGTASSKETTHIRAGSILTSDLANNDTTLPMVATHLFRNYPRWLCRGSTSYGLLKAVATSDGYEIQTRAFGICLLSFGSITTPILERSADNMLKIVECTIEMPIKGGFLSVEGKSGGRIIFAIRAVQEKKKNDPESAMFCRISTSIFAYRPAICGTAPISIARAGSYLAIQSIVHCNVMWRFHRHCSKVIRSTFT